MLGTGITSTKDEFDFLDAVNCVLLFFEVEFAIKSHNREMKDGI